MRERIEAILKSLLDNNVAFDLVVPEHEEFGHYSTSVAMRIAKQEKKVPLAVANEIADKVRTAAPKGFFEKVDVAPPGFINFWIAPRLLHAEVLRIHKEKQNYGLSNLGKGKKVQVEYVSANPTGPLTLANGRGGFLGDVLSNVLDRTGHNVEREYYVNDTGNQIVTLGKSILALAGHTPDDPKFYKGEYVSVWAKAHTPVIKQYRENPLKLGQAAAKDFLSSTKHTLTKKARIRYDRWTSEEKDIHSKGFPSQALSVFKKKGLAYAADGATWLKTTGFGDDKDRVLMTSDGFPTYFLADAGHYLETKKRGFDTKINVLGPDHYGYIKRIQAAAAIIGLKESHILLTQAVRLVREGKEVKMSKRGGTFVPFEELIDEVGADAARFFFLMVAPQTHMDFDLGLAKERSVKNPVYYAQYAYVRCKGILEKTKVSSSNADVRLLNTHEDMRLMLELARFPEALEDVARTFEVHRLTRYASELARIFHAFYEKERIVGAEKELAAARLALVRASQIVFSNLFDVLGIGKPKKM